MTSIIKGDCAIIVLPLAWAELAMAQRAQHEISAALVMREKILEEAEDRALYTLKQAIEEDPDEAVHWHQLGLHNLCTTQLKTLVKFLKAAVTRRKEHSSALSNLGNELQLFHHVFLFMWAMNQQMGRVCNCFQTQPALLFLLPLDDILYVAQEIKQY